MTIFEAMQKTINEAKSGGRLVYLYYSASGYRISRRYWSDWVFRAYPGGRKELSGLGRDIALSTNPPNKPMERTGQSPQTNRKS